MDVSWWILKWTYWEVDVNRLHSLWCIWNRFRVERRWKNQWRIILRSRYNFPMNKRCFARVLVNTFTTVHSQKPLLCTKVHHNYHIWYGHYLHIIFFWKLLSCNTPSIPSLRHPFLPKTTLIFRFCLQKIICFLRYTSFSVIISSVLAPNYSDWWRMKTKLINLGGRHAVARWLKVELLIRSWQMEQL
jgi:hypothetical protein